MAIVRKELSWERITCLASIDWQCSPTTFEPIQSLMLLLYKTTNFGVLRAGDYQLFQTRDSCACALSRVRCRLSWLVDSSFPPGVMYYEFSRLFEVVVFAPLLGLHGRSEGLSFFMCFNPTVYNVCVSFRSTTQPVLEDYVDTMHHSRRRKQKHTKSGVLCVFPTPLLEGDLRGFEKSSKLYTHARGVQQRARCRATQHGTILNQRILFTFGKVPVILISHAFSYMEWAR